MKSLQKSMEQGTIQMKNELYWSVVNDRLYLSLSFRKENQTGYQQMIDWLTANECEPIDQFTWKLNEYRSTMFVLTFGSVGKLHDEDYVCL